MERIPVAGPWITQKEIDYVKDAVENAWYKKANYYNEKFEKAFCDYIGVKYAIALPCCTSAIHLALLSLNIGTGHEVIVTDMTWIATAAPINYVGATPVFADIDEKTWCMSPSSFKALITPRTRAVIPVDLYGNVCDMDEIKKIAYEHGIMVIEDAAQAIGAEYKGRKAGSLGDIGVFSFHGSKTLTTHEGGMLVTDDEKIYNRCLILRDHGRNVTSGKMFWNDEVAFKYKMSSMQAALGLAQLERIDELVGRKREIFEWYKKELGGIEGIILNYEAPQTQSAFWMSTIVWAENLNIEKEEVLKKMAVEYIDCRPFFYPLSSMPAYEMLGEALKAKNRNEISYKISPYALNLPSALILDDKKVKFVCEALKKILNKI